MCESGNVGKELAVLSAVTLIMNKLINNHLPMTLLSILNIDLAPSFLFPFLTTRD